jgi:hypothetical protein
MSTEIEFGDQERATLAVLGDVLIPGDAGMPSAAAAGVSGRWLDELLRSRPDIGPTLAALMQRLNGSEPQRAVSGLRADEPASFDLLTEAVVGAYFLNADVRRLAGYPGQLARPIEPEDPPDYEQDGLIASVKGRGPIYRPTPKPAP